MTDRLKMWLTTIPPEDQALYELSEAGKAFRALRTVVELHKGDRDKKYGGITFCAHCSHLLGHGRLEEWPCPTIKAIEKEVFGEARI